MPLTLYYHPLSSFCEIMPRGDTHRNLACYLQRLLVRPSCARTVADAQPYFQMYPREKLA